jgi:hypothetical protein
MPNHFRGYRNLSHPVLPLLVLCSLMVPALHITKALPWSLEFVPRDAVPHLDLMYT